MPSSYVAGLKAIESGAETRFCLAYGTELKLRQKAVQSVLERTECEVHTVDGAEPDFWLEMFTLADRSSKTKLVALSRAELVSSWEPLAQWLDKCKPNRIVLETSSTALGKQLIQTVKNRGRALDCNVSALNKKPAMVKLLGSWYGINQAQMHGLLTRYCWEISDVLNILDQMSYLGMNYSPEACFLFGSGLAAEKRFTEALLRNKKSEAALLVSHIPASHIPAIIETLQDKLLLLARMKLASTGMKKNYELATELGVDTPTVVEYLPVCHRYTLDKTMTATLALANADRDVERSNGIGVLETLVESW